MAGYSPNQVDQYQAGVAPLDYGFLNMALSTKEGQYETGLNQVKSIYNGVLAAPLSNAQNQQARDQYVAEAQNNIKILSKADLSLPQNVSQAGKIFAPFYQDNDIVHDIYTTKAVQANNQQLETWKNSKDKEEFAKYNPIQEEYNGQTLVDLRRANRGDGSIQGISARKTIPYKDKMEYLRKAADDSGYEIEYDYATTTDPRTGKEVTSPYIKKVTNGAETIPNWKVWADATLGDNFQEQDRMFGQVSVDRYKNHLLQQNPSLKNADINHAIADDILPHYQDFYNKKFAEYKQANDDIDARLQEIKGQALDKNGNPRKLTPEEQKYTNLYLQQQSSIKGLQNKLIGQNPEIFNNQRDKLLESISNNPVQYFTDLEHNTAINNFAKGITALSSVKLEANSVWSTEQSNALQRAKMAQDWKLGVMKIQVDQQGNLIQGFKEGMWDAHGNPIAAGSNPILSKDITDITQLPNFTDRFKADQTELYNTSVNKIFDFTGVAGALSNKTLGMSSTDVMKFCEAAKKLAHPEIGNPSKEDLDALKSVQQKLKDKGINVDLDAESLAKGIQLFAQKEATRKDLTEVEKTHVDGNALKAGITAEAAIARYKANKLEFENKLKTELSVNPKLQKYTVYRGDDGSTLTPDHLQGTVKNSDGSITVGNVVYHPDMKGAADFAKKMPDLVLQDVDTHEQMHLPANKFAEQYGSGNYSYMGDGKVNLNNKIYNIVSTNGNNSTFGAVRDFNTWRYGFEKENGTPNEYHDVQKAINEKVTGNLSMYQNKDMAFGTVQSYFSANKPHKQFVMQASQELAQPGNQVEVYNTDKNHSIVEDEDQRQAIQLALNTGEYTAKVAYHNKGFNGIPLWEVQLEHPEGKKSEANAKFGNIPESKILGKAFLIAVNQETNSKLLATYPQNRGVPLYQDVLNGVSKEVSPYLSANGFSATVTPNKKDPDYVVVNGTTNERNPYNGHMVPKAFEKVYYLKGPNAKDIDEIFDFYINAGISKYEQNNFNLKQYHQNYK